MTSYQELWWRQAQSDHVVLVSLRRNGAAACHQLHYLQMVTEKLAKAYFWGSGTPPRRTHAVFVQYLRGLGGVPQSQRDRIAEAFGFGRFADLQNWLRDVLPLAYELQNLAPSLALDGPNPEYPWPQDAPQFAPVSFEFDLWTKLTDTGRGRQLMQVIRRAIDRFPSYG